MKGLRFHPPWKLPPVYRCILTEDTRPRVQGQRQITCHGKRCSKSRILCPLPKLQLLQAKEVEERERGLQRRQQLHFMSLSFQDWLLFRQAWTDSPRNVMEHDGTWTWWRIASYYQVIDAIPNRVPDVSMMILCAQLPVLGPVSSSPGSGSHGSWTS